MNIPQLRSFCEVVRQGMSISRAAQALHASQPAVSRHIRDLEEELGVEVLVRQRNRIIELTEPGRMLVTVAQSILADAERMRLIGQDYSASDSGALAVATTHAHARYTLPAVIKRFGNCYPRVQLSLLQGNPLRCAALVNDGIAHLGIAADIEAPPAELMVFPAYRLRRSLIAPKGHPILRKRRLDLAEIARYPLVTYDHSFGIQRLLHNAFAAAGLEPEIVLRAIDADVIKTYVEMGMGIAVVSTIVFDAGRDRGVAARDVTALFEPGFVNVYARRGAYLRSYVVDFVTAYAPHIKRDVVLEAIETREAVDLRPERAPLL